MEPGGTAYPMRSKVSSETPFFEVDEGTTRSRGLRADEYRRRPGINGCANETAYRRKNKPSLMKAFRYGKLLRDEQRGKGACIRHRFVYLSLQLLQNIRTTAELPKEVRQRGRCSVGTGDPEVVNETMN